MGIIFLVTGCSTPTHKPAADLCTGTKKPYQIKGVWYHPQDHYDYEEHGVASWYGPGFHERPKSCGNKFDMNELSAAHKTLPIPSVVEVTNVKNGKKLKLVVDDRGPFVGDRIIDLSKKAAQELGTHGSGLGHVHVKVLPEDSKALAHHLKQYGRYGRVPDGRTWADIYYEEIAGGHYKPSKTAAEKNESDVGPIMTQEVVQRYQPPAPSQPSPRQKEPSLQQVDADILQILNEKPVKPAHQTALKSGKTPAAKTVSAPKTSAYFVQVGSFVQKQNADKLKGKMQNLPAPTKISQIHGVGGERFFAINIGPFSSEKEARKTVNAMIKKGHHGACIVRQ